MIKRFMTLTGGLMLIGAGAALACDYPERPTIPNGAKASKEEMLAAKDAVTEYLAGVDEYLVCIENDAKSAVADMDDPNADELRRRDEMLNKKFDAANDEKALVGEEFNQQVRAYNAARSAD